MTDRQAGRPRPSPAWVAVAVGLVMVVVGVVAVARGGDDDAASVGTTTAPTPVSVGRPSPTTAAEGAPLPSLPPATGPFAAGRTPLPGFEERAITVTTGAGEQLSFCVLAALNALQRSRGLMTVTDPELGGYDGMLFVFEAESEGGFWMRNTPMPLTIAYLDAEGRLVDETDMTPCRDSPECPGYPPAGPYRMALEVPQGGLERLRIDESSRLAVGEGCAPAG